MSAEEEQFEESTTGAPGAPTPVGALEVRIASCTQVCAEADKRVGC